MKVILGIIGVIMSIYAIEITSGVIASQLLASGKPFGESGTFAQFGGIVGLGGLAMAAGIIWVLYQQFFKGKGTNM